MKKDHDTKGQSVSGFHAVDPGLKILDAGFLFRGTWIPYFDRL